MSRFELIIMRHGRAEDWADGGDAERRLTAEGRDQASEVGRALATLELVPDVVMHSPLRRARETAELVVDHMPTSLSLAEEPTLVPGAAPERTVERLAQVAAARSTGAGGARILAVGHNPSVISILGQLVCGDAGIHFNVATADVAHLWVETTSRGVRGVLFGFFPSESVVRLRQP